MDFVIYGINHKDVPVDIRERVSLSKPARRHLLHSLKNGGEAAEALVLDTCNRTEFYLVGENRESPLKHILKLIGDINAKEPIHDTSSFYSFRGRRALRHVFRTGASLDSQIVGETEILGQLKDAYRTALDCGAARFMLNKTLHSAFRTAKRVHSETSLCEGAASIPTSAVTMLADEMNCLSGASVLVLGAGKTAETAVRVLFDSGVREVVCANRNPERAEALLAEIGRSLKKQSHSCKNYTGKEKHCQSACDGTGNAAGVKDFYWKAAPLDEVHDLLFRVDAVLAATGAENFVLRAKELTGVLNSRKRPLNIVDIAVPRDVDPALGEIERVNLWNIDDLKEIIERAVEVRMSEIPGAEAIVEEEVEKFCQWVDSLQMVPTIKKLKQFAREQKKKEIDRHHKEYDGRDREFTERFAEGLIAKMLHRPFSYLNKISTESSESEIMTVMNVIHEMFELDEK